MHAGGQQRRVVPVEQCALHPPPAVGIPMGRHHVGEVAAATPMRQPSQSNSRTSSPPTRGRKQFHTCASPCTMVTWRRWSSVAAGAAPNRGIARTASGARGRQSRGGRQSGEVLHQVAHNAIARRFFAPIADWPPRRGRPTTPHGSAPGTPRCWPAFFQRRRQRPGGRNACVSVRSSSSRCQSLVAASHCASKQRGAHAFGRMAGATVV